MEKLQEKSTKKWKVIWELFITFAKIGCFTFGGGYSMLPLMQRELVDNKKWVTEDEVLDYYAIGQCTPGVIAVNTSTFVGYKVGGVIGGIAGTLGMIVPSMVIITVIAIFMKNIAHNPYVQHAFGGIKIAVVALMLSAILPIARKSLVDKICWGIFLLALCIGVFTPISSIYSVIFGAVIGITVKSLSKAGNEAKK